MRYWDTSALLKLYVSEPDSKYFLELVTSSDDPLLSADIVREEMLCALYRKEHAHDIKPGAATQLFKAFLADEQAGRIITIPNGKDVVLQAERLVRRAYAAAPALPIRSPDAIHVASALASKATVVVATDARLRDVAQQMGFKLLP